mmetsp:Transcript_8120/g.33452  ORF Transcript_8120/g.33452 Transcript_8120/m.33452 type:complete len:210 (+) Transcript_8120:389-1018(+)
MAVTGVRDSRASGCHLGRTGPRRGRSGGRLKTVSAGSRRALVGAPSIAPSAAPSAAASFPAEASPSAPSRPAAAAAESSVPTAPAAAARSAFLRRRRSSLTASLASGPPKTASGRSCQRRYSSLTSSFSGSSARPEPRAKRQTSSRQNCVQTCVRTTASPSLRRRSSGSTAMKYVSLAGDDGKSLGRRCTVLKGRLPSRSTSLRRRDDR